MRIKLGGEKATTELVANELVRRQAHGFLTDHGRVQVREKDRSFIAAAMSAAQIAIAAGSQPGDLRWNDAERDFAWIMGDNTTVPMDAHLVAEITGQALSYISALALAASALKTRIRAGEKIYNVNQNEIWPNDL